MAISSTQSYVEYTGDSSTTSFTIPFYFLLNSDISVMIADGNGNITELTNGTDFTVAGQGVSTGGTCVLNTAYSNSYSILVYREPPETQETKYYENGKFPAKSHESALDKLTMLIQRFGWMWDSLALKRPNYFADYFEAKGHRIADLQDPKNKQDAASKNYVDKQDANLQSEIDENANSYKALIALIGELLAGQYTILGDYSRGPYTITAYDQLITKDGYFYALKESVTLPYTTTGNTATTWATDESNFVAIGDAALRQELASSSGADMVGLPYGTIKNAIMYYTPEMFVPSGKSVTDWSSYINTAITQALTDGVTTVRGDKVYGISSSVFVDNFSTGLELDLGGLSANSDWAAYSDWKTATPLIAIGNKSSGSQVGLNIRLGFAYGRDLATAFQLSGFGAGGSTFHCDRMRNCVIGYQCDSSTSSGSASNAVTGGYWYAGKVGVRVKRGNSTYIAEGHKIRVGFITGMIYGGIQLFNGAQYFQISGTDVDFNGKFLAEIAVDKLPSTDIRGTNVTWNGINYEVVDYYSPTRTTYRILVIDSQETTGGNSTIKTATSTDLTDNNSAAYTISSVRTPTANQFYFDFIHGFEGSAFARGKADFGYMGGKVGGLQRTSFIFWHNSFDENSNELNGVWVRNQSSAVGIYDKWSGLTLLTWGTTGTAPTATFQGQVNVNGVASLAGGAYYAGARTYGTQTNITLSSGVSSNVRTFSFVGDGTVTTTKEVWNVTLAGPTGLSGIGGTFQVHVGSSGIEIKNSSGISYPSLSVSGFNLLAIQSAQSTMNLTFMFERKL